MTLDTIRIYTSKFLVFSTDDKIANNLKWQLYYHVKVSLHFGIAKNKSLRSLLPYLHFHLSRLSYEITVMRR